MKFESLEGTLKLLGPIVLVKHIDPPETKSSIIEVIEYNKELSQFGLVLLVGNGQRDQNGERIPVPVKQGDTVIVKRYSSAPIKVTINNQEIEGHIIQEDDILATIILKQQK